MNEVDLMSPSKVAEQYGGDKQKIAQAVQMGMIDPTVGVMAGMFIDRVRGAAMTEQQPATTVAQDVLAARPQMPPQMPTQMPPQAQMPPQGLPAAAAAPVDRGLAALPVNESMVPGGPGYAGGGIIAFAGSTGSFVENIIDKETREIEQGLRLDYSPEAKQVMSEQSAASAGKQSDYLKREQQLMMQRGRESLPYGRVAAPIVPISLAPNKSDSALPATAEATYPDESRRGTAKDILSGAVQRREFYPPQAPIVSEANVPSQPSAAAASTTQSETAESLLARRKALLEKEGVPSELFAADRAANAAMREKIAQDRSEAGAMALIEAGLGIAGGKSQYALQNIGEGAKGAVGSYAKSIRQIKEDEKEYAKIDRDLNKAEQAYKIGNVDKAMEYEDKAAQRANELRRTVAAEKQAARPSEEELRQGMFARDPEAYRKYREATVPGFESAENKLNTEAVRQFNEAKKFGFQDKEYMELKKAANNGDTAAAQKIKAYEARKFQEIYNLLRNPAAAIGGGAGAVDTRNPLLR